MLYSCASYIPANHPGFPGNIPRFQHRFRPIFSIPDFLALFCFKYLDLSPFSRFLWDAIPTSVLWRLAGMELCIIIMRMTSLNSRHRLQNRGGATTNFSLWGHCPHKTECHATIACAQYTFMRAQARCQN